VRIKKVQLTEPKVVMDRSVVMEEKVTNVDVPKLPGEKTEVGGKKKRLPSGAVQKAVREVLYENDKEGGLATGEITELVAKRIGEATQKQSVYSVLSLLVERGELTRPSHGYYRLPSRTTPAVKSESKPEDDEEQVLIEFLVMLDKVGAIVKRHIEFRKEFASLAQKLGKNG
jgi:hypothetical protein